MNERKIYAMHRLYGTCGVMRCKDCDHLIGNKYHDRRYYKCELYGITGSEATDWRLSYQACGLYNMHVKRSTWTPVIKRLRHSRKAQKVPEPPLEGQMRLEVDNG